MVLSRNTADYASALSVTDCCSMQLLWYVPGTVFCTDMVSRKSCRSVAILVLPLSSLVQSFFLLPFLLSFQFFFFSIVETATPWGYSDVARDPNNKAFGGHSELFKLTSCGRSNSFEFFF
jgi:hypothetical protein